MKTGAQPPVDPIALFNKYVDKELFFYGISRVKDIHIVAVYKPEVFAEVGIRPFTFCPLPQVTEHLRNRNIGR